MPPSLSYILPVRNAETTLRTDVLRLLDLLPDLAPKFELVVVDDGSVDHTNDVARELAREFPQIRVLRHNKPVGQEAAIRSAKATNVGPVVMTPESTGRSSAAAVPEPTSKGLLDRLVQWGQQVRSPRTSEEFRLIHQEEEPSRPKAGPPSSFLAHLRELAVGE